MKYEDMNCSQKLSSLISGYDGDENGAKDDGYYECKGQSAKLHYLLDCVLATDDISGRADIFGVYEMLEEHYEHESHMYENFMELETN